MNKPGTDSDGTDEMPSTSRLLPSAFLLNLPGITQRRGSAKKIEKYDSVDTQDGEDNVFNDTKDDIATKLSTLTVAPAIIRRRSSSKEDSVNDHLEGLDKKTTKDDSHVLRKTGDRIIIRRSSLRRRPTKDKEDKTEEKDYSHMKEACDKIVQKVQSERAVQNTIEALTDRWKMMMFMYEDLIAMMNKNKSADIRLKTMNRQVELIIIAFGVCAIALPFLTIALILWIF